MSDDIGALYATFHLVLELSHPASRLEQLGLHAEQIDALSALHAKHKEQAFRTGHKRLGAWYTGPRAQDAYWPSLIQQLSLSTAALAGLDEASTQIVSQLRHPQEPSFATRGLVVAHPQAGTITNIAAVITKAADQGYRLFIVLAGVHNALRQQTQVRLSQQVVEPQAQRWIELTSSANDFKPIQILPAQALHASRVPALGVVKKNAVVLRRLTDWLRAAPGALHEYPALVIDTEADYPSVAAPTLTPRISTLLNTLPRAAYLGYTHTPLANLIIEPTADDLFPRDFIAILPQPADYIGPEALFGKPAQAPDDSDRADDGYNMIRHIPEFDVLHLRPIPRAPVNEFVPLVPDSLREAVEYFFLVAAARQVRGGSNLRNTMLINTSINSTALTSFTAPIEELRADTARKLDSTGFRTYLRQLWQHETQQVAATDFGERPVAFDELLLHLPTVVNGCRIVTHNSSTDNLDQTADPVATIVVGSTVLTRGLALEGLSVGYFMATGSPNDALQQMNRLFGFRAGYRDLLRIWMTDELATWWREVVTAESELRQELQRALSEDTTPSHFALRARTHPKLRVIREARHGQPTRSVSYGGRRVQTRYFHTDAEWLRSNLSATNRLLEDCMAQSANIEGSQGLGRYIFFDVPAQLIIEFLTRYQFHERSADTDSYLLIDYIQKRISRASSLKRWNVALLGKSPESSADTLTLAKGITVGRIIRSRLCVASGAEHTADIKTLMSPRDAAIDLRGDIRGLNETEIRQARRTQFPHTGLLALYPIDRISASPLTRPTRSPLDAEEHVVGVGLVFPEPTAADSTV